MKPTPNEFEKMVLEHLDMLYRVALRFCRRPDRAEDLVQDTCYRAIRSRESFDLQAGGIRPWLVRILRNTFLSGLEHEARQPKGVDDSTLELAKSAPVPRPEKMNTPAAWDNMDQELVRALDDLPEEFRSVMILWALEDLSYQEIADSLEIPIGTVMSRLHRARNKLTQQLQDYGKKEGIIRE